MSETDATTTLNQILHYARAAQHFMEGRTRKDLGDDLQLELAVTRALEIAGEAARRLPPRFAAEHPECPIRGMTALRNFLAHGYDLVDLDVIWRVIHEEVPTLIRTVEQILAADQSSGGDSTD